MLIQKISLRNFLSYGQEIRLPLQPLNVIIGTNGSGKSNFIDAFSLLKHAPGQIQEPVRKNGGIQNWLYKTDETYPESSVSALVSLPENDSEEDSLHYSLAFTGYDNKFSISKESIYYEDDRGVYVNEGGQALLIRLNPEMENSAPIVMMVSSDKSILAQFRGPLSPPEMHCLAEQFEKITIYRDWVFGGDNPARRPQKTDLPSQWLEPDGSNLALVLNRIREDSQAKQRLLDSLRQLYDGIDDYGVSIHSGYAEVFLHEGSKRIPAVRLSDGTLRYLALLTILLNPTPPSVVCIEEPELGLHPDVLPTLAELLQDASSRMQLIVTTHSDILVDALSDTPEAVLVCEKTAAGSKLRRLDAQELQPWLEKYRLGELWSRGHIGGNRW